MALKRPSPIEGRGPGGEQWQKDLLGGEHQIF